MTRQLPATAVEMIAAKGDGSAIDESLILAYWLFGRDDYAALFHFIKAHEQFAKLADALGYTIAPKEVAVVEMAA